MKIPRLHELVYRETKMDYITLYLLTDHDYYIYPMSLLDFEGMSINEKGVVRVSNEAQYIAEATLLDRS
jgi:hypothetical protein